MRYWASPPVHVPRALSPALTCFLTRQLGCRRVYIDHMESQPEKEYSPDGVDLTLIRWMLSLTPAERLQVLQQHVNAVLAIRELNAGK